MPLPNLLHPTPITLHPKDAASTQMDDDAREPIQTVSYNAPPVVVPGQPNFESLGSVEDYTPGGAVIETNGYVLFRYVDLTAASVSLQHGDRITALGNINVDIYIFKLEPTAPYPDQGGFTMVKAHCKDRAPSRGVASP